MYLQGKERKVLEMNTITITYEEYNKEIESWNEESEFFDSFDFNDEENFYPDLD